MEYLQNEYFLLTLTFGVYFLSKFLQKKLGWSFLNPILISVAILILFLKSTGIDYEIYQSSGSKIDFWLKPAVVALGVPLYRHLSVIRKQIVPIVVSQFVGCITGILSVVLIAKWLGASKEVVLSLAAKSVTTPIAMEVTRTLGGIPSLTAAIVVMVGILGAMIGFRVLQFGRIKQPDSQGLSIGTASHAVGTSAAMDRGEQLGAFASLGLILNGVFTAIFSSILLQTIGII
ncbi:MAG: LrgB family protein [Bacteroidaceae bacterium]|nr:LrgB family protein [Bacteroidaceae bacterium]